jgi:predicted amidophosphoribosyltransferase
MGLQDCPHCDVRVLVSADGTCPSCRRDFQFQANPMGRLAPIEVSGHPKTEEYCRNCGKLVDPKVKRCRCGAPPRDSRNFCNGCGNPTYEDESECSSCGQPLATGRPSFPNTIVASNPPKDPTMVAALSVIPFPCLGQMFLGQMAKGFTMLIVTYVLSFFGIGLLLVPLSAIDAYCLAKVLRDGGSIGPWDFFWSVGKKEG